MRIIINEKEFDTYVDTKISQVKQTNDITSIETRQTNYTNQFDLPKTPRNVQNFEYLSLPGNQSNIPYQRNECYLFDNDTGECFIWKGWAIILETADAFKVFVYDGNIDFYKAIENFKLKDLDLEELSHQKDLDTVIASFTNEICRYILADYGGKITYNPAFPTINIDYLTPSVRVKYLWDKLFDYFGITYEGEIFQTEEFQNLWMTFPKGITSTDEDILVVESNSFEYERQIIRIVPPIVIEAAYYAKATAWDEGPLFAGYRNGIHMVVPESGVYRIDFSGKIEAEFGGLPHVAILFGKNTAGILPANVTPIGASMAFVDKGEDFEKFFLVTLNAYDTVSCVIKGYPGAPFRLDENATQLKISLNKVNPAVIDFGDSLIDFSATDFTKEILMKFGLSLFKDKYKDHYRFLTLSERLSTAETVDWTEKYKKKISEEYIYQSYAQRNFLKHKYNEQNADYFDGFISVSNANLDDAKSLFESKLYAPEERPVDYFGRPTFQYKTFNSEIQDNGDVKYRSLDKRFYFIRSIPYSFPPSQRIGSEMLGTEAVLNAPVPTESYMNISFTDVVQQNYFEMQNLLNRALIINVLMDLTPTDVANIDFEKLYFIGSKDVNGYFLLNKIDGYQPGKLTKVELVRVTGSLRLPSPRISFGFGRMSLKVQAGQTVDIWLNTIYQNFDTELSIPAEKISKYHYRLTATSSTDIAMSILHEKQTLYSNTLTLTVE